MQIESWLKFLVYKTTPNNFAASSKTTEKTGHLPSPKIPNKMTPYAVFCTMEVTESPKIPNCSEKTLNRSLNKFESISNEVGSS